ncbi:type II toxin-antitoxin system PemK/MazF family toxin [Wenzhouxiangella limi]|uniref:Type II toxin-antitoxin system PemK/MazF family toxin n=1 Tax=Wenzhouxiangella limi TaxID=2707351 RepID=A0A845V349_9GAMM|nr:type II toxin-antitoxin system PemK/MazF family toxin [Wenzhouxiangella limi]NDY94425.1 type II toxin-antitoxin system PemK/MazF family toxin [Wenzhouxiangella limi]
MKRGDLVTVTLKGDYGKPRPALVIQSDLFDAHPSVTIMPVTGELRDTPLFRLDIEPSERNGLRKLSQVMIDKIHTVSRERCGKPFGYLEEDRMVAVNRLMALFLGMG